MKACGALLFVLFCVCEADTEVQFQLSFDHHDSQGKVLELSLDLHHDQGTELEFSLDLHHDQGTELKLSLDLHHGQITANKEDTDLSSKYPQPVTQLPPVPVTQPPSTTVTQPPPASTAELICGQSQIQIGLLLTALQSSGLNGSSGHLADPRCSSFTERDGTVWYQVERQADTCGNTFTANNTHAIYSNSLSVYSANDVSLPDRFSFSCVYPLAMETILDVAIRPNIQLQGSPVVGSPASVTISLFQDSNYTVPYPAGPVSLSVGSALYVGVSVGETDPRFVVVLDDCYITNSTNADDPTRHFFIQNKCSTNRRQVTVVESGSSLQARFSALLFLFHGDYRDIYLHCSLHLCDQRASSCSPVCSGRRRRSVSTSVPFKPITIGPITSDYQEQQ